MCFISFLRKSKSDQFTNKIFHLQYFCFILYCNFLLDNQFFNGFEVLGLNFTLFCTLASKTVSTTPNAYMNIVPIIESVQDLNFKSCILVFPRDGTSRGTSRDKQKFNFDQLIKKCTLSFIHDFYKN